MKAVKNIKIAKDMQINEGKQFLDLIYSKSKIGASLEEIAGYLDMDISILNSLYITNGKVQKAFLKGKVEAKLEFKEAIRNQALNGNTKAIDKYEETIGNIAVPQNTPYSKFKGRLHEIKALLEQDSSSN